MNRNQNDINYQKEFIIKMICMSFKGFIKKYTKCNFWLKKVL